MTINFKLGKLATKRDPRNFQFKKLLVKDNLPPLPMPFDVDSSLANMTDSRMFLNDVLGCCVISGRGHISFRFEDFEQDIIIPITDEEIKTQYFKESGGKDSGLIMLDSLDKWRKEGWIAGGKPYNIYAFAQIDPKHHDDVMYGVYLLRGILCGLGLPVSAKKQDVWDVVSGREGEFGSWGGHCVYIVAYNETGPVCVTWGARKQMTWAFWDAYCDEAYAIVDNKDLWLTDTNPLNCELLDKYLHDIAHGDPSPDNPNPPSPTPPQPPKPWYQFLIDLWDAIQKWFVGR